jgi:hypothetical protein
VGDVSWLEELQKMPVWLIPVNVFSTLFYIQVYAMKFELGTTFLPVVGIKHGSWLMCCLFGGYQCKAESVTSDCEILC